MESTSEPDAGFATAVCSSCGKQFMVQFVYCGAPAATCPHCGQIGWPMEWVQGSGQVFAKEGKV